MPTPGQIPSPELGLAVNRKPSPFSQGYWILVGQTVNRETNKLTRRVSASCQCTKSRGGGCGAQWAALFLGLGGESKLSGEVTFKLRSEGVGAVDGNVGEKSTAGRDNC